MQSLGDTFVYKIVTNGTLLSDKIINFLNQYNIIVFISYDGEDSARDDRLSPKYDLLTKLTNYGLAVTVYNENLDLLKLSKDIVNLKEKYQFKSKNLGFFPNFTHQTSDNPNNDIDLASAKLYITQLAKLLEDDIIQYKIGVPIKDLSVLYTFSTKWFGKKPQSGVRCCSSNVYNLTLAGDFMLCPYGDTIVGNIDKGVNFSLINKYHLPDKCKSCEILSICRNFCVANITENECFIFKCMYKHYCKLLNKYNIPIKEGMLYAKWAHI